MREIKFRAWDKNANLMVGANEWYFSDRFEPFVDSVAACRDDFELMQFTGLLDRNGVEIYEGDILQLHCGSEDGVFNSHKVIASVVWDTDRFTVEIPDRTVIASGGSMKGREVTWRQMHGWVGMHTCLREWQSQLHVIGNIYENSELLTNERSVM